MAAIRRRVKISTGDRVDALIEDWRRERPELDANAMGVVGRILRLGKVLEARANAVLTDTGLNYTDLDVLATLRRSGAPYRLTPTALRGSVLITSGAMTACLDRLAEKSLVLRATHGSDRRSVAVELTKTGRTLIDHAIVLRFDEATNALSGLAPSDQERLASLLRELTLMLDIQ